MAASSKLTRKEKRTQRREKLQNLPVSRIIPNVLTLSALCAGMTSIKFALEDRWEHAIIAILIASVFDVLDGRAARILDSASEFGAELDSLSDFINFGVAPSLVIYLYAMHQWGRPGWVISLFFAICCGFRLARFNSMDIEESEDKTWMKKYFVGVPAPMGGLTVLIPLMINVQLDDKMHVGLFAFFLILGGVLMVSRVPTFALKSRSLPSKYVLPFFIVAGLSALGFISYPWIVLPMGCLFYLAAIPFSYYSFKKQNAQSL